MKFILELEFTDGTKLKVKKFATTQNKEYAWSIARRWAGTFIAMETETGATVKYHNLELIED